MPGAIEDVAAVLADATDLPRWWPAVYLDVRRLAEGDAGGVGAEFDLYTRGWLPYTLRWQFRVTEADPPHGFALEAWGDFVGRGVWTLTQAGADVEVIYDWRLRADKPLLRRLSFALKPVFAANHRWAMAKGEASLRLELARRAADMAEERARVPAPPGPSVARPRPLLLAAGAALAVGASVLTVTHRRGRRQDAGRDRR